ncbi:MotA/TolQ/ExbB proton channel family protein, partial [candidate division WOR-3 bacterium]|nr:MotA/TolQ/ExbB proton channel family protein [candidate division WOR-3 bacterium]
MLDFFQRGGWTMWFLLATALISVVFIIERIITFLIMNKSPQKFIEKLQSVIETEGIEHAVEYCSKNPSPVGRIMEAVLTEFQYIGKNKDLLEEAIAKTGVKELAFLDRGMAPLAAVTQLAPMLGFLGTVSGMVAAFDSIALAGTVEPKLVASGISQALIT